MLLLESFLLCGLCLFLFGLSLFIKEFLDYLLYGAWPKLTLAQAMNLAAKAGHLESWMDIASWGHLATGVRAIGSVQLSVSSFLGGCALTVYSGIRLLEVLGSKRGPNRRSEVKKGDSGSSPGLSPEENGD